MQALVDRNLINFFHFLSIKVSSIYVLLPFGDPPILRIFFAFRDDATQSVQSLAVVVCHLSNAGITASNYR